MATFLTLAGLIINFVNAACLSVMHVCFCVGALQQESVCVAAGQEGPTASAAASEASTAADALEQTAETPAEGQPAGARVQRSHCIIHVRCPLLCQDTDIVALVGVT